MKTSTLDRLGLESSFLGDAMPELRFRTSLQRSLVLTLPLISKPFPLHVDYNRDPHIQAPKRKGVINHGFTLHLNGEPFLGEGTRELELPLGIPANVTAVQFLPDQMHGLLNKPNLQVQVSLGLGFKP